MKACALISVYSMHLLRPDFLFTPFALQPVIWTCTKSASHQFLICAGQTIRKNGAASGSTSVSKTTKSQPKVRSQQYCNPSISTQSDFLVFISTCTSLSLSVGGRKNWIAQCQIASSRYKFLLIGCVDLQRIDNTNCFIEPHSVKSH